MKKIFISFLSLTLILTSSLSSFSQVGVFNSVKTKALNVKGISAQNNAADSLLVVDAVSGKVGYINKNRIGGGGTPAGSDKQLQYNNSGSFGASPVLTFDASDNALKVSNVASAGKLTVEGSGSSIVKIESYAGVGYVGFGSYGLIHSLYGYNSIWMGPNITHFNWYRTPYPSLLYSSSSIDTVFYAQNSSSSVGVRTGSPKSVLDANGSFGANIRVYAEDFTITLDETDHTVIFNNDASIVYWPAASAANNRRIYVIVNRSNVAITSSSYISLTGTATSIPSKSSVMIQSDGYNWYQIK